MDNNEEFEDVNYTKELENLIPWLRMKLKNRQIEKRNPALAKMKMKNHQNEKRNPVLAKMKMKLQQQDERNSENDHENEAMKRDRDVYDNPFIRIRNLKKNLSQT